MAGTATQAQIERVLPVRKSKVQASSGRSSAAIAHANREALRELCHDLLQPVSTIAALVAAAHVEVDLQAPTRDRLGQVSAEVKRLVELCRHCLSDEDAYSAVLVHDLAAEVAAGTSLTSPGTVGVRASPAVVYGDATALRRAITNLVENGVRAAGPGGTVLLSVTASGSTVSIAISDSGAGFGTGEHGVAGLGLRIAARVAHAHGGQLTIGESTELGGAEVVLSLPTTAVSGAPSILREGSRR